MFTVKAFRFYGEEGSSQDVFSCQSYQIYERPNGSYEVSVYKGLTKADGVCFNVSKEGEHYNLCYIENSAGKTIDKITA